MDDKNMYPQMPALPDMPDAPPTYNQTYPTAPPAEMTTTTTIMLSSDDAGPIHMQPQQLQPHVQPQPVELQNLPPLPPLPPFGPTPCLVTCPFCHKEYKSTIRMEKTNKTHLIAALLCILGGILCVWIPYYVDTFKNAVHYCSRCNAQLGVYKN